MTNNHSGKGEGGVEGKAGGERAGEDGGGEEEADAKDGRSGGEQMITMHFQ